MNDFPKTLFVSAQLPQGASGGAFRVLGNLFDRLPADRFVVVGRAGDSQARREAYGTVVLPRLPRRGQRFSRLLLSPFDAIRGSRAARRFGAEVIVAVFPDDAALLTGYLIHRLTRLPLVTYFFDLYQENRTWNQPLALWLQPRVLGESRTFVALNAGMAQFYQDRYGLCVPVIPPCVNDIPATPPPSREPGARFVIGFSGTVNPARRDGLRALLEAVADEPEWDVRLFTPTSRSRLETYGIESERLELKHVTTADDLVAELSKCDALYLPVTFSTDHDSRDQLATCFGVKSLEYMLANRPIVVQSPADYFTARFFVEREAAYVVTSSGADALRDAFRKVRQSSSRASEISARAFSAVRQFDGDAVSRRFTALVRDAARASA